MVARLLGLQRAAREGGGASSCEGCRPRPLCTPTTAVDSVADTRSQIALTPRPMVEGRSDAPSVNPRVTPGKVREASWYLGTHSRDSDEEVSPKLMELGSVL